jgi:hypothetical protein
MFIRTSENMPLLAILAILGLKFYTIATLVGFAVAWASAVYLALIGFRGNAAECSSSCLLGLIPGGLAWIVVFVCGHRVFTLFFTESRRVKSKPVESLEIGHGLEEERILATVRGILAGRRVAKRVGSVDTLAWSDVQTWQSSRFKWQGFGKPSMLIISTGLRGRLEMEDWDTYLGWHYRQQEWLKPSQTWYVMQPPLRALLPLLLLIALAAALSFSRGQYASQLFASITGPAVLLLFLYRLGPAMRRLFLRLDSVAAESLGYTILLSLFKRIDMLNLEENENAKKRGGWVGRLWPEPNITERIANLQHASLGSS